MEFRNKSEEDSFDRWMETYEWHKWFVWYPIRARWVGMYGKVWLETVWRRRIHIDYFPFTDFEYKPNKK